MIRRLFLILLVASSARAASEYPPWYRWQTLTTEHFYVHFHQDGEDIARRAAAIAENVHVRLTPLMKWEPRARTHLILTDHVDVSNGSATPWPRNRIEVFVSAPGGDPSSPISYYDDWLELVIVHEYAHILHLDQARGIPRALRSVLGRNPVTFPNEWSPLWMIEGLATFIESEMTDAGRVKGTFAEMVLRAAAIGGRWPSEAQASGLTPFWPGGASRYLFGSKFLAWIARRHGTDALARYFNEYSGRLIPYLHNRNAEVVFGASISELWREWSREQRAVYAAELERLRAEGLTQTDRLTPLGYETKYPALSPDGTRVAYAHRGPYERGTIRIYDLASRRDVESFEVNSLSALSWSADGKALAFSQLEFAGSFSILSDLYVWRDGRVRQITRGARLKDPAFADEQTLIAVENRGGRNRLVSVDIESGVIEPLVAPHDETQFSEPDVHGDLIVVAEWKSGRIDVVTYTRSGARVNNLTESLPRSANASPRFTEDGSAVVFMSDVTGIPNVFVARGGDLRRVTNVAGGAFFPVMDRGRLYFSEYHAGGFDLAVAEVGEFAVSPQPRTDRRDRLSSTASGETHAYSAFTSIAPTWWSPIASSTGVGVTTSGGDVLGFHQYTATITNEYDSFVYAYDRLYPTITFATLGYDDDVVSFRTRDGIATYTESNRRLLAQVSAPFRRYRWQTAGWIGAVRDSITGDPPAGVAEADLARVGVFRGTLQGLRLGALFNNAEIHPFSISRESGITARLDYENLSRALGSDRAMQQYRADVRGYLSMPFRHVLAARVAGGKTTGDFVLQRELRVGGISEGLFVGVDTRNFPVRGYDGSTLRGNRAAIASLEYRLPVWNIDRGPSTWPLFFNRLVGDVFVDAGRAWQRTGGHQTIASVGAEAAIDLFLNYFAPLRYRAGVAYRLRAPGKGELEPFVALESSF